MSATTTTPAVRPEQTSVAQMQTKLDRAVDAAWHAGEKSGYMKGFRTKQVSSGCLGFLLGCLFVAFWTWMGAVS